MPARQPASYLSIGNFIISAPVVTWFNTFSTLLLHETESSSLKDFYKPCSKDPCKPTSVLTRNRSHHDFSFRFQSFLPKHQFRRDGNTHTASPTSKPYLTQTLTTQTPHRNHYVRYQEAEQRPYKTRQVSPQHVKYQRRREISINLMNPPISATHTHTHTIRCPSLSGKTGDRRSH